MCGLLAALAAPAPAADPQAFGPIRRSLQRRLEAPVVIIRAGEKPLPAAATPGPKRRRSVARKILGGVLGGVGGFVGGLYLGAAIEGESCNCDDPGLRGAVVGAPIGLVLGAIAGVALASK